MAGQPIVAGWSDQWIAQLDSRRQLDCTPRRRRIHPDEDATTATIERVQELVGRLGTPTAVPMFVFDAGYDPIALDRPLDETRAQVLVRIRRDRVFYRDPSLRGTGRVVDPGATVDALKPSEACTMGRPDAEIANTDPATHGESPTLARGPPEDHRTRSLGERRCTPDHRGSVPCVDVEQLPRPHGRANDPVAAVGRRRRARPRPVFRAYLRRFDLEHTFRFTKTRSEGRHRACGHPNRPTVGHGPSSPR